jgi:hypothetical protein
MLTMKAKATKLQRPKSVAKKATGKKGPRTLAECEAWFEANWDRATAAAKENTKRLTGRDCL